ncbi:MAG: CoB--CoM heterodisulfide reductase subunit C [Candidatus Thorarchaeota archaeon]
MVAKNEQDGRTATDIPRRAQVYHPEVRDEKIIAALADAGLNPNACMQCGTCTASCPSGRWTAMRTRNIVVRASYGDPSVLQDADVWLCTTCYRCHDRCPRKLEVTDIIIELRNLASERGLMSEQHRKVVTLFHTTGHAVPINDETKTIRRELGLPELPPTIFRNPDERRKLATLSFRTRREH